jgi:hypothetical protein
MNINQCFNYIYGLSIKERKKLLFEFYSGLDSILYKLSYREEIQDDFRMYIVKGYREKNYKANAMHIGKHFNSNLPFCEIYIHTNDRVNPQYPIDYITLLHFVRSYKIKKHL